MARKQMFMPLLLLCVVILTTGCSLGRQKLAWRVRDVVLAQTPALSLQGGDERIVVTLPTKTLQQMMLAHFCITRSANVQTELFIVDARNPTLLPAFTPAKESSTSTSAW